MNEQDKKNIFAFLSRVDLKGSEAAEFNRLCQVIQDVPEMEIVPMKQEADNG